jgi:flagellar biosynthesis protein FliP
MGGGGAQVTEKNFQAAVQYGSIVLGISVIFNIYVVMHYVEVYRDATRSDLQVQQMAVREQAIQGVLQDFAARSTTDPQIAQIFKQAQAQAQAAATAAAATRNPVQP